jgi:hypothetical protein
MKHYIHVVARQIYTLLNHFRLLGQDVKIKTNPVPAYNRVATCNLSLQIIDESHDFMAIHLTGWTAAIYPTMPKQRVASITQECRCA